MAAGAVKKTEKLEVKVFSPYQIFYEGTAVSLTATNPAGTFDVLYNHSNFFSLLMPGRISVDTGFERILIQIDSGIIRVADNKIVLFANV